MADRRELQQPRARVVNALAAALTVEQTLRFPTPESQQDPDAAAPPVRR
jgi:hypothetical protein